MYSFTTNLPSDCELLQLAHAGNSEEARADAAALIVDRYEHLVEELLAEKRRELCPNSEDEEELRIRITLAFHDACSECEPAWFSTAGLFGEYAYAYALEELEELMIIVMVMILHRLCLEYTGKYWYAGLSRVEAQPLL